VDLDALVAEARQQVEEDELVEEEEATQTKAVSLSKQVRVVDPLQAEVESILALHRRGAKINAHHQMKKLSLKHPGSVTVARGIVTTARGVKAWGEAYDAAELWLNKTSSAEAGVAFARLQKATLRGNPVETLEGVLKAYPEFAPAKKLLEKYRGKTLASR
jgi:hypothetical protein